MAKEKKEQTEISVRLYHEDTLTVQNKFRNWIELLIRNKGIVDSHYRTAYFKNLSKATFEVGRGSVIVHITKEGDRIVLGKFYKFAQLMAYQTKTPVKITYHNKTYLIPIEDLWRTLLLKLLDIFPFALEEARRLSAERFRMQARAGSVEFEPSTRSHRS